MICSSEGVDHISFEVESEKIGEINEVGRQGEEEVVREVERDEGGNW